MELELEGADSKRPELTVDEAWQRAGRDAREGLEGGFPVLEAG